jgi:hypothetical protein
MQSGMTGDGPLRQALLLELMYLVDTILQKDLH